MRAYARICTCSYAHACLAEAAPSAAPTAALARAPLRPRDLQTPQTAPFVAPAGRRSRGRSGRRDGKFRLRSSSRQARARAAPRRPLQDWSAASSPWQPVRTCAPVPTGTRPVPSVLCPRLLPDEMWPIRLTVYICVQLSNAHSVWLMTANVWKST